MAAQPADVLGFWTAAGPSKWFKPDAGFDEAIRLKFEPTHRAAARGEYDAWAQTPEGWDALRHRGETFPRKRWRASPHAFATDPLARQVARAAVAAGHHVQVASELRGFYVLPFEHSEDLADQDVGVALAEAIDADALKWARIHRDIIARFGRFPHRNRALGRNTTAEEQAFLDEGGFAG
jgi:uncharacterized protein (DUF924 family)